MPGWSWGGWPLRHASCHRTPGSLAQPGPWSVAASLGHRAQLLQEAFLDFPCHICLAQPPSGLCCPVVPPPLISQLCLWAPPECSRTDTREKRGDPEGWGLKHQGSSLMENPGYSGLPGTGLPLGLCLLPKAALAPLPALSWGSPVTPGLSALLGSPSSSPASKWPHGRLPFAPRPGFLPLMGRDQGALTAPLFTQWAAATGRGHAGPARPVPAQNTLGLERSLQVCFPVT